VSKCRPSLGVDRRGQLTLDVVFIDDHPRRVARRETTGKRRLPGAWKPVEDHRHRCLRWVCRRRAATGAHSHSVSSHRDRSRGNSEHRTATESPKRAFVGLPICHTSTPREMRVSYTSILVKIGEKTRRRRRRRRRGSTLPLGRPRHFRPSTARGSDSPPTVRLPSSTSLSLSLSLFLFSATSASLKTNSCFSR
jgi:hypothetical protein